MELRRGSYDEWQKRYENAAPRKNCSSRCSRALARLSTCTAARRLNFGDLAGSGERGGCGRSERLRAPAHVRARRCDAAAGKPQ